MHAAAVHESVRELEGKSMPVQIPGMYSTHDLPGNSAT